MKITLHRTDAKRYWTAIARDDGACFDVRGIGFMGALPHDLAHLVVEQELGLANGFWGTVAAGGIFGSMTATTGARPFHSDARSLALMKANQDNLNDAELLVGAFTDALDKGTASLLIALSRYRKGSAIKRAAVSNAEALRVLDVLRSMQRTWLELPIGGEIMLVWPEPRRDHRKRP
jgi:hypothetical protein